MSTQHIALLAQGGQRYFRNLKAAQALLSAYQRGDEHARQRFRTEHPKGQEIGFEPTLLDARLLVSSEALQVKKLSIEKLKKEAKDLLKAIKAEESRALLRVQQSKLKKNVASLKLADAQWVVAQENGLSSWPKLKAYIASLDQARNTLMHMGKAPPIDSDLKTLHIRCGDDIQSALIHCGFRGDFLEISNPFAQGQVVNFNDLERFVSVRSQAIRQNYSGFVPSERIDCADKDIRHVEDVLTNLPCRYERVVLWFEHDPFDQLCLAYVLSHCVDFKKNNFTLELVLLETFPGVEHLVGLGQLCHQQPESLVTLWSQRVAVGREMVSFAERCWQAFINENPTALWHLTRESRAPLPIMQQAFKRMLKELPWEYNGLSLTEALALETLEKGGELTPGMMFHFMLTEFEPLPFLGDIMFLSVIQALWSGSEAPIDVVSYDKNLPPMQRYVLRINDKGRALIEGDVNYLEKCADNSGYERWVGGVKINTYGPVWLWSEKQGRPILSRKE